MTPLQPCDCGLFETQLNTEILALVLDLSDEAKCLFFSFTVGVLDEGKLSDCWFLC